MSRNGKYQSLPGDRDPAYATDGRLTLPQDFGTLVILLNLSDQSSIISSYTAIGPRLAKVTVDGKLATSFGEQGVVKLKFDYIGHQNGEAYIFGVIEIEDEAVPKLLLLLSIPASRRRSFAVARLLEHGALDLTFGSGKGYEIYAEFVSGAVGQSYLANATTAMGGENRYSRGGQFGASVQVDDNKTLVVFNIQGANDSTDHSWFFRLDRDGKLDLTFGNRGFQEFQHPGGFAQIAALTPAGVGKFVAAGHCFEPSVENGAGFVARFFNDASVDESFGDKFKFPGYYQTPDLMEPGSGSSFLRAVSVDALGYVTSIGFQYKDDSSVGIVVRLSGEGTFDPSFNGGDVLKVEAHDGMFFTKFASAVSADGLIYIPSERNGIQRRLKSGNIDLVFGQDGYVIYPDVFTIADLAQQQDGKLLMLSDGQNSYIDRLMV